MRNILLNFVQKLTGKPRYHPEDYEISGKMNWSNRVWVSNVFRVYEWFFGRGFGIRAESSGHVEEIDGIFHVKYEFYTPEAFLSHLEVTLRLQLLLIYEWVKLPRLDIVPKPVYLTLGILGILFHIKTSTRFLPLFGLAIALDTAGNGTTTSTSPLTFSYTCTGSNLILIAFPALVTTATPTLSAPTYNSTAMTLVDSQRTTSASTDVCGIYYLLNPTTGSNTLSVSFTGTSPNCNAGVVSWSGVAQSGQPDASTGSSTNLSSNPSFTVTTVADNCWVAGGLFYHSATTPVAQLTNRWTGTVGGGDSASLEDTNGPKTPAGAQTVNWTHISAFWGAEAASFSPAGAAGAAAAATGYMTVNTGFWGT